MGTTLRNPVAGPVLFFLRQVEILRDYFDRPALGGANDAGDILDEQLLLTVLEGRNVHHHVDFLRAKIEDVLRLILLHRGGFVAVREAHHGPDEHAGATQYVDRQRDVMWLHSEGSRVEPGGGIGELHHRGPRGVGTDDRMIEELGEACHVFSETSARCGFSLKWRPCSALIKHSFSKRPDPAFGSRQSRSICCRSANARSFTQSHSGWARCTSAFRWACCSTAGTTSSTTTPSVSMPAKGPSCLALAANSSGCAACHSASPWFRRHS